MKATPENVIRWMLEDLEFPLFAVDQAAFLAFVAHPLRHTGSHFKLAPLAGERSWAYRHAFVTLAERLRPTAEFLKYLQSESDTWSNRTAAEESFEDIWSDYASALLYGSGRPQVYYEEDWLRWDALAPWPTAFGPFLHQLFTLMRLQCDGWKARRAELPQVLFSDEGSRLLPTGLLQAAASLGSWIGGTTNIHALSRFATDAQVRHSETNLDFAVSKCGFDLAFARELDESGLVAIPQPMATAIFALQGSRAIGALQPDEGNIANMPDFSVLVSQPDDTPAPTGLLFDKYYRTPFIARRPAALALLGSRNVYRDHYRDFYESLGSRPALRCKHYCAPIIDVACSTELVAWLARVPQMPNKDIVLRGQSRLYMLKRAERVKRLLFGDSCADEPSLCSSAARANYDYDRLHYILRYYVTNCALPELSEEQRMLTFLPDCKFDYAIMALAQHYGLPSHGLDITRDPQVAIWFATNRLVADADGRARYDTLAPGDWGDDPANWPVVFALQTVTLTLSQSVRDCAVLNALGLPTLRPARQSAKFMLGGHSDHQNRLAEAVVCAFRLAPGNYETEVTFTDLFPSPHEDPAYAAMLAFEGFEPFKSLAPYKVLRFHD